MFSMRGVCVVWYEGSSGTEWCAKVGRLIGWRTTIPLATLATEGMRGPNRRDETEDAGRRG